jgi:hypothetical protein
MSMVTNTGYADDRMNQNQNSPNFTHLYSIRNIPYFLKKHFPPKERLLF